MKEWSYERKGLGEDWFSHHWFCDVLRNAKQLLAEDQIEQAEHAVAIASLYALERMNTNALVASLSVLADVLEAKGETLQDYFERGYDLDDQNPTDWGRDQAA